MRIGGERGGMDLERRCRAAALVEATESARTWVTPITGAGCPGLPPGGRTEQQATPSCPTRALLPNSSPLALFCRTPPDCKDRHAPFIALSCLEAERVGSSTMRAFLSARPGH